MKVAGLTLLTCIFGNKYGLIPERAVFLKGICSFRSINVLILINVINFSLNKEVDKWIFTTAESQFSKAN